MVKEMEEGRSTGGSPAPKATETDEAPGQEELRTSQRMENKDTKQPGVKRI